MTDRDMRKKVEPGRAGSVQCAYCRKSMPAAEAYQPEGQEYMMYFCGLECFDAWREQAASDLAGEREGD